MDEPNELVFVEDGPDVSGLLKTFERCAPVVNGWDRLRENDRVRYTIWDGQSPDGKKWDLNQPEGRKAFPFDGASDQRVNLADEIIEDCVTLLCEAFWRGVAKATPVQANDAARAGYAQKILKWLKDSKLYRELVKEIELHAQNGCTYGMSLLHVTWVRELRLRYETVTLGELLSFAVQALPMGGAGGEGNLNAKTAKSAKEGEEEGGGGGDPRVAAWGAALMDPTQEEEAVTFVQELWQAYLEERIPPHFTYDQGVVQCSKAKARKIVRDLRDTGLSRFPAPYACKNQPNIRCLKLWEDVFFTPETCDIQDAPVVFVKEFFTEQGLRTRAAAEGWNEGWVEAAVKEKGKFSSWVSWMSNESTSELFLNRSGYQIVDTRQDLIEVLYAYTNLVDEEGVSGIYYTVLHHGIKPGDNGSGSGLKAALQFYGKHEMLDYKHGKQPFVVWQRECIGRPIYMSRGIPEIVATWQRAVKVQEDSLTDRTSFETLPPVIVPSLDGIDYRFGPAVQIPVARPEMGPRFMEPPRSTPIAFELIEMIMKRADRYFGRARTDEPPETALMKKQKMVRGFLLSVSEGFQQLFALMEQYMDPEEFARVTGSPEPISLNDDEIGKQFDYVMSCDVAELNPDLVAAKLEAISKSVLPEDSGGVIDRSKLTMLKLRAIDPTFADELVMDQGSASQQLYRKVNADFVGMFSGNPPELVENDPTAQAQLQFAKQIVMNNPKYMQAMKTDPHFRELVEQWMENRQFSVTQEDNKQVGRLGVQPAEMGQGK